jgi:ABC-2 type transport system permease protein
MNQTIHIIKYKIISFLKLNPILNFGDFLKSFGSLVVYSGFALGTYLFTKAIINYLLAESRIGLFLLHEFLSIILFIFLLSINVGNIIVSFSTLYKSGEINFLLSKPVPPVRIFIIKFLDNFFYSSSTLLLIIFAAFLGYGNYFNINIISVAGIVFFNLLPMMFSASLLGVIILLLLMKLSTWINFRIIIYSLIAIYIVLLFSFFKITSPVKLVNKVMEYYPNVDQYFDKLIPPVSKLLPNHWLSESLYWIVLDKTENAIPYFVLQIFLSLILLVSAITLGRKWYYLTWLHSSTIKNRKGEIAKQQVGFFDFGNPSIFRTQTDVIIKKDIKLFFREPSQVIHLTLLLSLITVFIFSLKGLAILGSKVVEFQTIIYLSVFVFNVLFISTLSLRFVFPIVSLEGESFWKIKTSPVGIVKIARTKLLLFLVPIFIIAQLLSYFSSSVLSTELTYYSSAIMMFASITLVLLNFGLGIIFANFKEKNPIRISSSQGAAISFLVNIFFMIFLVVILIVPFNSFFKAVNKNMTPDFTNLINALIFIGLISSFISFLFYKLSVRSLKNDF